MNLNSKKNSKQLHNEELEALADVGLNDLVKNFSLRNKFDKFAGWVWVATSAVVFSISMTMPAQAEITRSHCTNEGGGDQSEELQIVQGHDEDGDGEKERKCFEGEGEKKVKIHNVESLYSRENIGSVETNRGTFQFWENEQVNFNGPVVITGISLDPAFD